MNNIKDKLDNESSIRLLELDFKMLDEKQLQFILKRLENISTLSMKKSMCESHSLDFTMFFISSVILFGLTYYFNFHMIVVTALFAVINLYFFLNSYLKLKKINDKFVEENNELSNYVYFISESLNIQKDDHK
jgi:ABC-type bacteriocin/lantibiotic exporter with double-glycine peptidase domain